MTSQFHSNIITHAKLAGYVVAGLSLSSLAVPLPAWAAGDISKGFTVSSGANVGIGSLVALASAADNTASPATTKNTDHLLGVVGDTTTLEFGSNKQVQVITSGIVSGLVSDVNGAVKSGDKITASPVSGVGMKATTSVQVVGVAQGDLNTASATAKTIVDKAGVKQTIHVGSIPIQVNVSYYSQSQDKLSSFIPPLFFTVGKAITGKDVSPLRILSSLVVLALGFGTVAMMLQAGIRSGIIAIGRNPLAQKALRKSLLEVVLTAIGTLLLTIVIMYLLLSF